MLLLWALLKGTLMLNVSKLYCGVKSDGDALRYKRFTSSNKSTGQIKKPIVVWNITNRCNLHCAHCYANANTCKNNKEFSTYDAKNIIDDLASFKIPVLLFSGGEPLLRNDLPELIKHTVNNGMRAVVSTNGVLIDKSYAERLKATKVTYVGISIDGMPSRHNKFRGDSTAYSKALSGIRACIDTGLKVGLRFTIFKENYQDLPYIFNFMENENIPRICLYHLVCSGRGESMKNDDLSIDQKRKTMDLIINKTKEFHDKGLNKEILTVDNHCDGVYLYLRMLKENNARTEKAIELLRINKGSSSGTGIASINWDGSVYPDQFWRNKVLGNVKDSSFDSIWNNPENEFLKKLRNRTKYLKGRCSTCKFLDICGGNFRARAEAMTGDMWQSDPGCYITDEEIL